MISELEKSIRTNKGLLAQNEEKINIETSELGQAIYKKVKKATVPEELSEYIIDLKELEDYLPDLERQKQQIEKKLDKIDDLKEKTQNLKATLKNTEEQMASFHVEIGKAAFRAFKDPAVEQGEELPLFSDLLKAEEKIRNIDNEVYQISVNSEGEKFFAGIINKGKSSLLLNRKKNIVESMASLFRKCGEQFCNTDLFAEYSKTTLADLAEPYNENRNRLETIEKEILQGKESLKIVQDELKELDAGKSPRRKIMEIEDSMKKTNDDIEHLFFLIGEAFMANSIDSVRELSGIPAREKSIQQLIQTNKELSVEIEDALIEISIEKIVAKAEKKQKRVDSILASIEKEKEEVSALQEEMKDMKKEVQSLQKQLSKAASKDGKSS